MPIDAFCGHTRLPKNNRKNFEKGKFKMVKRLLSAMVYKLFILVEKIYWYTGIDIMPVWMRVNICEFQGEMRKEK